MLVDYLMDLGREAIAGVERLIRPHVRRTPVLRVGAKEFALDGAELNFKLELFQHSGSFKARGAFANLLTREVPRAGVVAASGGNHGAAVAYAASRLGVPARIYVPTVSSPPRSRSSVPTGPTSWWRAIAMPTRLPPPRNGRMGAVR